MINMFIRFTKFRGHYHTVVQCRCLYRQAQKYDRVTIGMPPLDLSRLTVILRVDHLSSRSPQAMCTTMGTPQSDIAIRGGQTNDR